MLVGTPAGTSKVKVVNFGGVVGQPPANNRWGTERETEAGEGVRAKAGFGGKWKVGVEPSGVAGEGSEERKGGAKTI